MKILIVEDEFTCRKLLGIYLSQHGQCFSADNGQEAIEAFEQSLFENDPYDLICMDIGMPKVDGIEAVRRIREIEERNDIRRCSGVKIIMTTIKDYAEDIDEASHAGCEAFLTKPIHKQELHDELEKLGLVIAVRTSSD